MGNESKVAVFYGNRPQRTDSYGISVDEKFIEAVRFYVLRIGGIGGIDCHKVGNGVGFCSTSALPKL